MLRRINFKNLNPITWHRKSLQKRSCKTFMAQPKIMTSNALTKPKNLIPNHLKNSKFQL